MLLACSDGCRAMRFALQTVACCCMAESSDLVRGLAKPFLPEKPVDNLSIQISYCVNVSYQQTPPKIMT